MWSTVPGSSICEVLGSSPISSKTDRKCAACVAVIPSWWGVCMLASTAQPQPGNQTTALIFFCSSSVPPTPNSLSLQSVARRDVIRCSHTLCHTNTGSDNCCFLKSALECSTPRMPWCTVWEPKLSLFSLISFYLLKNSTFLYLFSPTQYVILHKSF